MTSLSWVVPEDLLFQDVPSDEVRMVPDIPTVTNALFPNVSPYRLFVVPEVLLPQEVSFEDGS